MSRGQPRRTSRRKLTVAGCLAVLMVTLTAGIVTNVSGKTGSTSTVVALPDLPDVGGIWKFDLTDDPGSWFDSGVDVLGTKSLAVSTDPLTKIEFSNDRGHTHTVHTASSLLWPTKASGMPFDQPKAWKDDVHDVTLKEPGLYAFVCKLHPFMLSAVIVDDPTTVGLDLGKSMTLRDGRVIPTDSDLAWRIIRAFFIVTNTGNWQVFKGNAPAEWDPSYPPAPVLAYNEKGEEHLIPNLDDFFQERFKEPATLPAANTRPDIPGVGEVWIDLQYEKTAGKTKPGTATAVNTRSWAVSKKFALPSVNMNNPHNMWTDRAHKLIYQTEWFDDKLTVFDRETGKLVRTIDVGEAPSHVMTRTDTDQIHVAINGEDHVAELAPGATAIDRKIPTQAPGEEQSQPHAHWMSADGHMMVSPNSNTDDSTQVDIPSGTITQKPATGKLPIASAITPDAKRFYTSNFLEHSVSCVSTGAPACHANGELVPKKKIDLMENYDPVSGAITGPIGGLPIQTPVSPDGKYVMQANTLTATVTIIDTDTDTLVKSLPCDAGCHGINYGAKKGGGYYAYVSSKFANTLMIVDGDPNGDGEPIDAKIVGKMILNGDSATKTDDTVSAYPGQGGQGVLPLPLVYNGWVQKLPPSEAEGLTCKQRHPIEPEACD